MSPATCVCKPPPAPVRVIGVPIHTLTPEAALAYVGIALTCPNPHVVHHLSVDPLVVARRNAALAYVLERAFLNLPDGMGVVWGGRAVGASELRRRVYGPDFMMKVLEWGLERQVSHAFVGGFPKTLDRLVSRLRLQFDGLQVVGAYAPPVRRVTVDSVREDLTCLDAMADVLWVGLGTPKQQVWAELARAHAPARVIVTVGAAFDFLSGSKPQAPLWMRERGLEWVFRLFAEPGRLWRRYLVGNPTFAWGILQQRLNMNRKI